MCPGPFALWIIKWGSEYKTSLLNRFYGGYIFQNPVVDIGSKRWGAGYIKVGSRVQKVGSRVQNSGASGTEKWGVGYAYIEASNPSLYKR
jgi:hypothetical protein